MPAHAALFSGPHLIMQDAPSVSYSLWAPLSSPWGHSSPLQMGGKLERVVTGGQGLERTLELHLAASYL